jgi:hypothetical protein
VCPRKYPPLWSAGGTSTIISRAAHIELLLSAVRRQNESGRSAKQHQLIVIVAVMTNPFEPLG